MSVLDSRLSPPVAALAASVLFAACAVPRHDVDRARAIVMNFVDAANARDFDRVAKLLCVDFTRHSQATPDVVVRSREDMVDFLRANARVFADEHVELEETLVDGDRVAFRGTYSGKQIGTIGPYESKGHAAQVDISGVFRVQNACIAELWILWDNLALLGQLGHAPGGDGSPDVPAEERNKALARVWFDEVINERNLDAIDRSYADDYVHHGPGGATMRGIAAAREFASRILAASNDRHATVERQIATGNLVVTHFVSHGRLTGPFLGHDPSGKEWTTEGMSISRIENGKIVEDWEVVSHSGL